MSRNVFANGREISAKKDGNQSICAMPDVCLSPPSPPAGPVPVPYPNTAKASDTCDGSKSVKIGGAEVGLKNASSYKKSFGDEAATKSLGMGVVTHNIQGKLQFAAWSFDVKIEGKNVIRHMDLTTHNHMNTNNSGDMTINQAAQAKAKEQELTCDELDAANKEAREKETQGAFKGGAHTTAYRRDRDGNGKYMKAMCPNMPKKKYKSGYQDPLPEDGHQPECKDGKPTDGTGRRPGSGRMNDSENKILNPEMKAGKGGMIKMSTFHTAGDGADAMPCYSCRQAICEAEQCGIEVWLCKSSNKPPEAVRPQAEGMCPPAEGKGPFDESWAKKGLGPWPA